MKVLLAQEALQFDVATYLSAHFPDEEIVFVSKKHDDCDFIFYLDKDKIGLEYLEGGKVKYDQWMGQSHSLVVALKDSHYNVKAYKVIVKHLIYQVAGSAIGRKMPWGILTGVRPTKLVYQLIKKHGKNREKIAGILHRDYKIAKDKVSLLLDIVGEDAEIISGLKADAVNLYIGIPFCPSKCVYCSFPSQCIDQYKGKVDTYLSALYREMAYIKDHIVRERPISTIYIGGGTPTSLNERQLEGLLETVTRIYGLEGVLEFTVEAGRPDTITEEKLGLMKHYGVDRISINPQTMNQETLDLIGRNHSVESIQGAYEAAKTYGFHSINMDLIVGLPGESRIDVLHTLESLWQYDVDNVTVHTLSLKKGSALINNQDNYHMATAEEVEEMLKMTRIQLEMMGLKPYYMYRQKNTLGNFENVGYARSGKVSPYNIIMIEEAQTVIGMGAGAVSKVIHQVDGKAQVERVENLKNVDEYIYRVDELMNRKRHITGLSLYTDNDL